MNELVFHEVHVGCHVGEVLSVSLAEVVESRLAVVGGAEAVLGTAAVAGEEPLAGAALCGQAFQFGAPEVMLALAIHHCSDALAMDVAQEVLWEDEVVAGIDVAVVLDDGCMSAGFCHATDSWLFAHPAGKGGVE